MHLRLTYTILLWCALKVSPCLADTLVQSEAPPQLTTDTSLQTPPQQKDSSDTSLLLPSAQSTTDSSKTAAVNEGVVIDGIVLIRETGDPPQSADSVVVVVDSTRVPLSPEGEFSAIAAPAPFYTVAIRSPKFAHSHQTINHSSGRNNYFITVLLEKRTSATVDAASEAHDTAVIPWTIAGTIVDSRYDLVIRSPKTRLLFDADTVKVSEKVNFQVTTHISGRHTFHCTIPGYHPVTQSVILNENDKQLYVVIPTTVLGQTITRREITVSANQLPLHRTANTARTDLSRKDLARTAATMGDPMRVLQTLPGVTTESDVSARPIIRGGDVQESRVFLDGLTLIQPFHFGGVRSTFNQSTLTSMTLYKSGFPAELHNAQSGIIEAHSRIPSNDILSLEADVNYMQYCFYAGVPLFKGVAGINISGQGSYADAVTKLAYGMINPSGSNQDIKDFSQLVTMPDYRDFTIGASFTPSPRLTILVNEMYNTDRTKYCQRSDSMVEVTFNYKKQLPVDSFVIDTTITRTIRYRSNPPILPPPPYFLDANHPQANDIGEPYIDTIFNDKGYPPDVDTFINIATTYYKPAFPLEFIPDTSITRTFSWWRTNDFDQVQMNYADYQLLADKMHDGKPVVGKPYTTIDTLMNYASKYNILYTTAKYVLSGEHLLTTTLAWQKRWWDLSFPNAGDFIFGNETYDVSLDQANANVGWLYTGLDRHTIKAGGQLDYTWANYRVCLPRFLHEIIVNGNTNLTDFWGPMNGDSAYTITDTDDDPYILYYIMSNLVVAFDGKRSYYNLSAYLQDEWDITPKLHCTLGGRLEYSRTDHETWFSPRLSMRYALNGKNELTGSAGLYTQNNYDISAIALSKELKPEKVWHAATGIESKLLPWLEQKVDVYGKYYYDLLSEVLTPMGFFRNPNRIVPSDSNSALDIEANDPGSFAELILHEWFSSSYVNDGRGYAFGIDYQLRYSPTDFWHGWISMSWGRSFRERRPGWRVHPFPLERPLLFSIHNYYRLPKEYEIGLKYRYASGIPYTSTTISLSTLLLNNNENMYNIRIGAYNDSRFAPYHRLDLRFSKGFAFRGIKGHTYAELWNILNTPNMFQLDKKSRKTITFAGNFPVPLPFFGIDCTF